MEKEIRKFIDAHLRIVEPLFKKDALLDWEFNISGSKESAEKCAEMQKKIRRIYGNKEEFNKLKKWNSSGKIKDRLLARQVKLLLNNYWKNQIDKKALDEMISLEKDIEYKFYNYRARIDGREMTDNEIVRILCEERKVNRRKEAWEGSKQIGGEIAPILRDLVVLRNEVARKIGFPDFYFMKIHLQELNEKVIFNTLAEIDRGTFEIYKKYKNKLDAELGRKFGCSREKLMPWHYSDPFFQRAPQVEISSDKFFEKKNLVEIAIKFYSDIGLDVKDILKRSDLFEKSGKCQHAFCTHIDRRGDVRILCNIIPSERWMETLLHELGHAVYDKYLDMSLPFLLREPAHSLSTEAVAIMFGRYVRKGEFLKRYVSLPDKEVSKIDEMVRKQDIKEALVFIRWCLVMINFERELYRNPNCDLNGLWWELVGKFQGLAKPEGRNTPDWAAKIHLGTAPVYYQNYLLGQLVAIQLWNTIISNFSERKIVNNLRIGNFLIKKVFSYGSRGDWNEALKFATGERLNTAHFINYVFNRHIKNG